MAKNIPTTLLFSLLIQ